MPIRASLPGYARITGEGVRGLAIESSRLGVEEILAKEEEHAEDLASMLDGVR